MSAATTPIPLATLTTTLATARHTRLQVQLGRPQWGGGVAEWGMSLVDDDEELVRQYGRLPPRLTLTLTTDPDPDPILNV